MRWRRENRLAEKEENKKKLVSHEREKSTKLTVDRSKNDISVRLYIIYCERVHFALSVEIEILALGRAHLLCTTQYKDNPHTHIRIKITRKKKREHVYAL